MGIVKKIIPKRLKNYLRRQLEVPGSSVTVKTVYEVRVTEKRRFDGKTVMVTGGSGAIGSAICRRLLAEGAVVGICGRNAEKIDAVIKRFTEEKTAEPSKMIPVVLDVTDDENIENAIDEFVKKTGRLDVFVNNAGGGARKESRAIHRQKIEVLDTVLDINLRGSILCARKAAQIMVGQNFGKIINMSSVVGLQGKEEMSDYAAAKAGIVGFTRSLAMELGRYNITVNCISPGMVNQTPFDRGLDAKPTKANILGRFGYTDEVAALAAFAASEDADYITGHNFVIDGGRSLGLRGD